MVFDGQGTDGTEGENEQRAKKLEVNHYFICLTCSRKLPSILSAKTPKKSLIYHVRCPCYYFAHNSFLFAPTPVLVGTNLTFFRLAHPQPPAAMAEDISEVESPPRKRDIWFYVVLVFCVGPVWGVIPASWLYVAYSIAYWRFLSYSKTTLVLLAWAFCEVL